MVSYLIYSIPNLTRMKKLSQHGSVEEMDVIRHSMAKKWAKGIIVRTGTTVGITGETNIPAGPVLFVSNHEGDFDIPVLLGYIEKPFGFLSKVEVQKVPVISQWMTIMNCVFVDRKDKRQAVLSIKECIAKLKNGHSLVVFPEGTRNKGKGMHPFKTGAFRVALEARVPIVPIQLRGTADIFENQTTGLKPAYVMIDILPPVVHEEYQGKTPRELADYIQEIITGRTINKAS
ncbi:1-acyl-sn-glycerol-3-phosphate acyltransferase [Bacillus salacetis]|uniref:1-acyl-sn-glycerol-3-phosphate acyltransferase n=2 Tax=Bacillus salacetis TaxID=2315464 RepID=A0A3A1QT52_9BACI|nr:1-acyl-sn-glycerol-3-phosphate acyltransferase [Bacillus salacetis]